MPRQDAYIGTYTDQGGEGLYVCEVTVDDGGVGIARRTVTELADDPSFLAVHPGREYLYVVHEVEDGAVTALRREDDGSLARLNRVPSGAGGPCHCSVHPSGDYLLVAHYTGGAVSVLPIRDDGELAAPTDTVAHEGSSVHPERQNGPHPHSITPGPNGRFLYVPDLGTDEIVVYELDGDDGTLSRAGATSTRAGAGPRHLAFHPDAEVVYVVNELDSTASAFEWTPETGGLSRVATVATVPDDHDGDNFPADVHVHPSGRWVYASNRGHDSIVAFEVEEDGGTLAVVGHQSTEGEWPRNFAIDASGRFLFAENQRSDDVVAFGIDEDTGALDPAGATVQVPAPACMECLPALRED